MHMPWALQVPVPMQAALGVFWQLPLEQLRQSPPQALLQHLPSTQKLLVHWLAPVQEAPLAFLPSQRPPVQKPVTH
jgi:hypothetical protein